MILDVFFTLARPKEKVGTLRALSLPAQLDLYYRRVPSFSLPLLPNIQRLRQRTALTLNLFL